MGTHRNSIYITFKLTDCSTDIKNWYALNEEDYLS